MSTLRQEKVVANSRNNYKSKGDLLRDSGYSEATAIKPSQVLESKGIRQLALRGEAMGINDDLTLRRVKEAMEHRNINLAINTIFNWWRVIYPNEKPDTQLNLQINNYSTLDFWSILDLIKAGSDQKLTENGITSEAVIKYLGGE